MANCLSILLSEPATRPAAASDRLRWLRRVTRATPPAALAGRLIRWRCRPGDLLAVTGSPEARRPAILDAIANAVTAVRGGEAAVLRVERIGLHADAAPIDHLHLPRGRARQALIAAGLDCAWQQVSPVAALGEAERWQLRLAVALAATAARPHTVLLLARRWCHDLDAVSARRLCRRVRRMVRDGGLLLAVETARRELLAALRPTVHLRLCGAALRIAGAGARRFTCQTSATERGA